VVLLKFYLYYSSIASNNLQVSDIGNTLRYTGILEGTSLATREGPSLGPTAYYKSIQKYTACSTLKGSRHPSTVNLYLESYKESSSCILRASNILVYPKQVQDNSLESS